MVTRRVIHPAASGRVPLRVTPLPDQKSEMDFDFLQVSIWIGMLMLCM